MTALRHLRSDTADKRPDPSALSSGQLAINYEAGSPGLFFKDTNGNLVKAGPVHIGTSAPNATPAAGGSTGNAKGEFWLDTTTGYDLKVWDGSAWRSAAGEYVNITGDTMTGNLVLDNANLVFEGATPDSFETTLTVVDPTADRTITLPNVSGTVVTTGDTGTVTSTMIANATIVDVDISASAEIAVSKLADGTARQLLQTDAAGTGVEWTSNVDVPGTLDVTGAATFDSTLGVTGAATFTDDLIVDTNTLFVDASANAVGIGTASPGVALHVDGDIRCDGVYGETDTNTSIQFPGSDVITFNEGGSEAARVDASGRLLIGTSSARTNLAGGGADNSALIQVEGTTFSTSTISVARNSNDAGSPAIELTKTRGTAIGQNTIVVNGDPFGFINFAGTDGTNSIRGASISAWCDGTPGANDMPGRLVFSTTADGQSSPTERMRIQQDGNILIGRTSNLSTVHRLALNGDANVLGINTNTGTAEAITFYSGGTKVGNVTVTPSATQYNTSSDYRLKENITVLQGATYRLNQLNVYRFNFLSEPDKEVDGFLAHEAQAVVPECVTGEKDAVDDEGNPVYQGIDQSKLVPLLTAALQEALAEIEILKARVTALEP